MTICSAYYGDTPRYVHSPFNAELAPTHFANLRVITGTNCTSACSWGRPTWTASAGLSCRTTTSSSSGSVPVRTMLKEIR